MTKETEKTKTADQCIFCKIIKGEIPAVKLWEDKDYFIFLDANPIMPGHALVVPKSHEDYLFDMKDQKYVELMLKVRSVAKILKERLNPKRVGMIVEGFSVHHVHVHLVPINIGNELNPLRAKKMDVKELNKIADKIRGK